MSGEDRLGPYDFLALLAVSLIIGTALLVVTHDHNQRLDVLEALLTPTPEATAHPGSEGPD